MFTIDTMIDAVQNGNKEIVNAFIKNEALATAMNQIVDSQFAYTKETIAKTIAAATVFNKEATRVTDKFDYTNFADAFAAMKPYPVQKTAKK